MLTSLADLDLTPEQQVKVLEWLAYKIWIITEEGSGDRDYYKKSYDPLTIELDKHLAHSYVFSLSGYGRHHPFESLEDLEKMLVDVAIDRVKEISGSIQSE